MQKDTKQKEFDNNIQKLIDALDDITADIKEDFDKMREKEVNEIKMVITISSTDMEVFESFFIVGDFKKVSDTLFEFEELLKALNISDTNNKVFVININSLDCKDDILNDELVNIILNINNCQR